MSKRTESKKSHETVTAPNDPPNPNEFGSPIATAGKATTIVSLLLNNLIVNSSIRNEPTTILEIERIVNIIQ